MNNINRKPQTKVYFFSFAIAFLVLVLTSVIVVSTSDASGEFDAPSGAPIARGASSNPVSINETVSQTLHVNPSHSNANDSNPGTSDRPFRTIERAAYQARQANKTKTSTKVLIYPGTYREGFSFYGKSGSTAIFEAKEPGTVIVSGSDIWTGWSSQGNNTYTRDWPHNWGLSPVPNWGGDAPNVPDVLRRREIVFVNGKLLRQVTSSSQLSGDTYYVDEGSNRITIKLNSSTSINNMTVEVGMREALFSLNDASNVIVRGLTFQHANSHFDDGAVWLGKSQNVVLENNVFQWNNGSGVGFGLITNIETRGNRYVNNGVTGYGGSRITNLLSENEIANNNNWRGAWGNYVGWSVAGVKHLLMRDVTYINLQTCYNQAHGLWLDTDNKNVVVDRLFSCSNANSGLYIEANQGPVTTINSIIANNARQGILGSNSENVYIHNNILYGNGISQIYFSGENSGRSITDYLTGQTVRLDPGENWTVRDNIAIAKNNNQYIWEFTYSSSPFDLFKRTTDMNNNTLYHRTKSVSFRVSGSQVDFNGYKSRVSSDSNSKYQDVCFRNPDNNDFTRCDGSNPIATPKPAATNPPQPTSQPGVTVTPNANGPAVARLVLINGDSDLDLRELKDGDIIDLKSLPSPRINVRAETNPSTVGSVKFDLNGSLRTENGAPYTLYSDDNGNYAGITPNLGDYTLKVTAYSGSYQGGTVGPTLTVRFKVVNDGSGGGTQPTATPQVPTATPQAGSSLNVVSFTLVNADSHQDIMTLPQGGTIDLKSLPTRNLSVRANTNPNTVGSVMLKLNTYQTTENMGPYTLYGDDNGKYYGRTWGTGDYTMYGLAYSKSNQTGTAGQALTINFKLVDGGSGTQPTSVPPTSVPPTKVSPTSVSPTTVPPTKVPPTSVPPTSVPPTPQPATGPSVTSFTLIDSDTDRELRTLVAGETINLANLPMKLNIRANTNPASVGSVKFNLNGNQSSENGAPYAIYGDENGDYYGVGFAVGTYNLSATAYTRSNNSGVAGRTLTISFKTVYQTQPQPTTASKPIQPTTVPPTNVPPTNVPPTNVPPTNVPPVIPTIGVPTAMPTTVPTNTPRVGSGIGLAGQYFNTPDLTGNFMLRLDATIGFNWDLTSPLPGLNTDFFSVRWTGQVEPQFSETYTFFTKADDGTRLWVNGVQVINDWSKHWVREVSGTITLNAGQRYDIKLEYFDDDAQARVDLLWSSPSTSKQIIPMSQLYPAQVALPPVLPTIAPPDPLPTIDPLPTVEPLPTIGVPTIEAPTVEAPTAVPPTVEAPTAVPPTMEAPIPQPGTGLSGEYFNTADLTGPALIRADPTIAFNWDQGAPMPGMPVDFFSVRWTGWVVAQYSETYTFTTFADDGTRLWINGVLILDDWSKHWVREASGTITLEAGQRYEIRLEYFDDDAHSRVDLLWSSPSTPKQIIPSSQLQPAPVVITAPVQPIIIVPEPLPTIGVPPAP